MSCCGTRELVGVSHIQPEELLRRLTIKHRFAHVFFTDTKNNMKNTKNSGWVLAKYIKDNKLGTLVESPGRVNPNSGNTLIAWIWTVSRRNLNAWKREHKITPKLTL